MGGSARASRRGRTVRRLTEALWRQRAVILVTAGVAALSWPANLPAPLDPSIDGSWVVGLPLALSRGLAFGPDVLFTYGPLGFLTLPTVALPLYGVASLLFLVFIWLTLAGTLTALLMRALPWFFAAPVALGVLLVIPVSVPALIAVLVLTLTTFALLRAQTHWEPGTAAALGALAGFVSLIKVDMGVASLLILGIATAGGAGLRRGWKSAMANAGFFSAGAVTSVVLLWVLLGQPISALPDWIRGAIEIGRGYSGAMGLENPGLLWNYPVAIALVAVLGTLLWCTRQVPVRVRATVTVVLVAGLYVIFRVDFTRHASKGFFFSVFLVLPVAFVSVWSRRDVLQVVALAGVATVASSGLAFGQMFDLGSHIDSVGSTTTAIFSSSNRAEFIKSERTRFASVFKVLSAETWRELRTGTVHVIPVDSGSLIFAHPDLRWKPLPVFQDYSAYTKALDDRNANALITKDRPRFVLRRIGLAIDGRLPRFEPPREQLELLCRYSTVRRDPGWVLLQAGIDRCGSIQPGPVVNAHLGQRVPVPPPGADLVLARFSGLANSLTDRLRALVTRGPERWASPDVKTWFRFVPGTQASWHVLAGPECSKYELDGSGPSFPSVVLSNLPVKPSASNDFQVQFARVPYRCTS